MSGPMRSFRAFLKDGTLNPKYLRELTDTRSSFGSIFETWDGETPRTQRPIGPDEDVAIVSLQRPARTFDLGSLLAEFGQDAANGLDTPNRQAFRTLHAGRTGRIAMSFSRARELGL